MILSTPAIILPAPPRIIRPGEPLFRAVLPGIMGGVAGKGAPGTGGGGGGGGKVATYLDHGEDGSNLTTYSFTGKVLGASGYNLVGIIGSQSTRTVSSVTIDGVAASLVTGSRVQQGVCTTEFWIAASSGNSSGTVSITWSGGQDRCAIAVWQLTGIASSTPVGAGGTNVAVNINSSNVTINSVAGGVVCGIAIHHNTTIGTVVPRNMTDRITTSLEASSTVVCAADGTTSGSTATVGFDQNGGSSANSNSPYSVVSF